MKRNRSFCTLITATLLPEESKSFYTEKNTSLCFFFLFTVFILQSLRKATPDIIRSSCPEKKIRGKTTTQIKNLLRVHSVPVIVHMYSFFGHTQQVRETNRKEKKNTEGLGDLKGIARLDRREIDRFHVMAVYRSRIAVQLVPNSNVPVAVVRVNPKKFHRHVLHPEQRVC